MRALVVALLLLNARAVSAQEGRDALAWPPGARRTADVVSTAGVVAGLALPCLLDRTWTCAKQEAGRVGLALVVAELTKHFVHRTRPDGSDDKSFFSEHTALTCAATLRTKVWALCPAVGYLRVAAERHWVSDVGVGAGVGALVSVAW